jgi:hypothetical protein
LGNWLLAENREGILKPKHKEKIIKIGMNLAKTIDENKDIFLDVLVSVFKKRMGIQ